MTINLAQPALLSATERLEKSRERLRVTMLADANPPAPQPGGQRLFSNFEWLNTLKSTPGARILLDAVGAWWSHHPLHRNGLMFADVVKTFVTPLAQRNPVALIAGSVVLGGLFAWSRPWRWLLKPALFAGLMPQLISKVMAHQAANGANGAHAGK